MLYIMCGPMEYGDGGIAAIFQNHCKAEWFKDPFVQHLMKYVGGTTLVDGIVLKNAEGESIPPEYLSTGTKTAILVYEFPNMIFNATQMRDNAFLFVSALCKKQDRTVLTYRYLPEFLLEAWNYIKMASHLD